jgi:hypothetical protein
VKGSGTLKPCKHSGSLLILRNITIAVSLFASGAASQKAIADPAATEYEVKAAFLLNFVKFVEWPAPGAEARKTFSICVLGEDRMGGILDRAVQGESINGQRLVIERVRRWQRSCRVLFVGGAELDVQQVLAGVSSGVLTVGEEDRFLREGGMIAFVLEDRRVRFDVNNKAVQNGSLRISSRMLTVARRVLP